MKKKIVIASIVISAAILWGIVKYQSQSIQPPASTIWARAPD